MFFNRIEYSVLEKWKKVVDETIYDAIINDLVSEFHEMDYSYFEPVNGDILINPKKYDASIGDASYEETLKIISKVLEKHVSDTTLRAEMMHDFIASEQGHDIKTAVNLLSNIEIKEPQMSIDRKIINEAVSDLLARIDKLLSFGVSISPSTKAAPGFAAPPIFESMKFRSARKKDTVECKKCESSYPVKLDFCPNCLKNSILRLKKDYEDGKISAEVCLNKMTGFEGKSLRFITKDDAKLCELNFIARFDMKMHNFPLNISSPIENKTFVIKSWQEDSHIRTSEIDVSANIPSNISSRYIISEKKNKLSTEKIMKVVITAVSFNHLKEFAEYGLDARRANLAEFLGLITRFIDSAELGKYLHIIGIASPTGWDERVVKEVKSSDFARNYVSRYVSVCLVDSVTGEVFYNLAEERITSFVSFFTPEFKRKKVEKIKKVVLEKLRTKGYVVFNDIVEETRENKAIVHKALCELESEKKEEIRYIKEVGLLVPRK